MRGAENWQDVFNYDESVKLDHLTVFKDHIVIYGRQDGLGQIWVSVVGGSTRRWTGEGEDNA